MEQYTINIDINKDGEQQQRYQFKRRPMIPCDQGDWMLCGPKHFQYGVFGRMDFGVDDLFVGQVFRKYTIFVELCDPNVDPLCQQFQNDNLIYSFLVMYNNIIRPDQPHHEETVLYNASERAFQTDYLQESQQIQLKFQLKKAIIQTDTSLFPTIFSSESSSTITQTWFYDEQKSDRNIMRTFDNVLLSFQLRRSAYTHRYTRHYKKLDQIFGEIFGIMGFISAILFGLYAGYNGWSFQQDIRRQFAIFYQKPGLARYYLFLGMGLLYKFCACFFGGHGAMQREIQAQRQVREQLDVKILLERIRILEDALNIRGKGNNLSDEHLILGDNGAEQKTPLLNNSLKDP